MLTSAAIGTNADATDADSATFKITDENLHLSIVTLWAEGNAIYQNYWAMDLKEQFIRININYWQ